MKLNTDGVAISILILILMILTCHTMNYLFPRDTNNMNNSASMNNSVSMNKSASMNNSVSMNKSASMNNNINNKTIKQSLDTFFNIPSNTNYNKIYYQNQKEKKRCDKDAHPHIPCKKTCSTEEDYALSDSELAFLYKYAYEEAGKEILMRKLNGEELD